MTELRVLLTAMPWQAVDSPSLPLGLLKACCRAAGRTAPMTYFGNIRWVEYLYERSEGDLLPADYTHVADEGIFQGIGDWVFTGVLHDSDFGEAELAMYRAKFDVDMGRAAEMRPFAEDFVELVAREILDHEPDLVGFSTTFMQNVPSLAVAARIKRYAPHVLTVFGGGNCDGPMGAALHRNFPFIDYVVRGEAELTFPALLDAIERGAAPEKIPGVCWRRDGVSVANPDSRHPLPPGKIPTPDYGDWFERFESSLIETYVEPKLVLESARGCWWGEAHQCTFCGLNGSLIQFRSKPADRMIAELTELVERHRTLDVIMVDNIIDNRYFVDVLPRIAALDWDLRFHYEVKSNLKDWEVAALRAAGVAHVQPGIESLSTRVLKLMDKGVHGVHNVRALRDCESAHLTTTWNYLYGFPGETPDDYWPIIRQVPALVHLQPPSGDTGILLERFSPHFDKPELGYTYRTPSKIYKHVYDLPQSELQDLVYLFDSDYLGVGPEVAEGLQEAINDWSKRHQDSTLVRVDLGGVLRIEDRRSGWPERDHVIDDPVLVAAYYELEHGRSPVAVCARLAERGITLELERLTAWLDQLLADGLVFAESGRFITLATTSVPVRVTR